MRIEDLIGEYERTCGMISNQIENHKLVLAHASAFTAVITAACEEIGVTYPSGFDKTEMRTVLKKLQDCSVFTSTKTETAFGDYLYFTRQDITHQ